jgi:hypothetical protein
MAWSREVEAILEDARKQYEERMLAQNRETQAQRFMESVRTHNSPFLIPINIPPSEYKTYDKTAAAKQVTIKIDTSDILPQIEKRLEPVQKAHELALGLLRDLPTRLLDAPMRARVLEVERALVEAIKPETKNDAERPKLGDACAAMVAGYDD